MIRPLLAASLLLSSAAAVRADAPDAQYAEVSESSLTVHDQRTQLEWERAWACGDAGTGAPACSWQAALQHCAALNANTFAGHADWRLPSVKELQTIVDRRYGAYAYQLRLDPRFGLPSALPAENYQLAPFWSSTPLAGSTSLAWAVDFARGTTFRVAYRGTGAITGYARCVRTRAPAQ